MALPTDEVMLSKAQVLALYRRCRMTHGEVTEEIFKTFIENVQTVFGGDGAVAVQWSGMWLCIERDGYTHS